MADLMPTNIEAEEAILGGIMIDPDAMSRIVNILKPEHFAIEGHKTIYRFALDLFGESKFPNFMLLATRLADNNKLEEVGGQPKLAQLVDRTVSAVNIDEYAKLVVDKYIRRRIIYVANEISVLGYDQALDLDIVLAQVESKVFALNKLKPGEQRQTIQSASEVCQKIEENLNTLIAEREQGILPTPALETGFIEVDERDLFNPGSLIVVAARPGMGKSAFATNVAFHVANSHTDEESKKRVLMFNLEMTSKSGIPSRDIRQANINFDNRCALVAEALHRVGQSEFYIDDSRNVGVSQIISRCKEFQANFGKLAFVCIDYLQLMIGSSGEENVNAIMAAKISEAVRQLKIAAGELGIPIMLLSQLNRGVESRNDKRPMLSDLRGSGGIEEHADGVFLLFREHYYNEQCEDPGAAELIVVKARNSKVGTIQLRFDAAFTTFSNSYEVQRSLM